MSQENVEIVRSLYEGFLASQGDAGFEAFVAGLEFGPFDPGIEWDTRAVEAWGLSELSGIHRGVRGGQKFWGEWLSAWEAVEFDYELIDAGDFVVALSDQRMRGRSTSIEVQFGKHAQVWRFRDGLVTHWKMYANQTEALEAAGLSE
ncbi:MAG: hypothetical protein QOG62_1640 [Thermoleophilaceae bacterium]|jgi:hypothetical protein|nr:hypothetical protein [Thermoleophilaceae bacterium]